MFTTEYTGGTRKCVGVHFDCLPVGECNSSKNPEAHHLGRLGTLMAPSSCLRFHAHMCWPQDKGRNQIACSDNQSISSAITYFAAPSAFKHAIPARSGVSTNSSTVGSAKAA
jgi:hypothetical protein